MQPVVLRHIPRQTVSSMSAIPAAIMLVLAAVVMPRASAAPINIIAAENFYGDIAQQIGGADVAVASVLQNPEQDPHMFEAGAQVARGLTHASIVIYNGIGYDPWMPKLLAATPTSGRKVIVVADLIGAVNGANPHIWYQPGTMLALARNLEMVLAVEDPVHAQAYRQRLMRFETSLLPLTARVAALRARFAGTPVTATEPVFNYMFQALGMQVRNQQFQLAVMNGTEPGARDIAAFETDLHQQRVKLLVYNSQATSSLALYMLEMAKTAHIPVVGATETEPPGKDYQGWILDELEEVENALARNTQ